MLSLIVDIVIRPEMRERFVAAIADQAQTSLAEETGCVRFDVCVDVEDPNRFILYETYADEEAFAAHRTTSHFARWEEARDACVATMSRTKAELLL